MKLITDADVKGKKVIVRVDFNVPIKDGKIIDDNRIVSSLKTINYLVKNNAKVILLSHLGRVKTEDDKKTNSLKIVANHLSTLVDCPVYFTCETRGPEVEACVNSLLEGEILLLENTRFEDVPKTLESSCDEKLSKYWASLGDIFVLDAFGTAHRCHASTYGISKYIPSYAGFLVNDEVEMLDKALKEKRKLLLGGAKVDDKIGVLNNLVPTSDLVLIGGAMCFTFLKAKGFNTGKSLVSEENLDYCKELLEKYDDKIVLPLDFVTEDGVKDIDEFNNNDIGFDIGPKTIREFESKLENSNLVLWNGPLGKYEEKEYENGTKELMKYLESQKYPTILAGGDVTGASKYFGVKMYYVSTGGGSTLEYLEGKKFKTLERLNG